MRLISALLLALAADAVAASNAFPITDFGARSGDELQTAAIQAAIDAASAAGGGEVTVPEGVFRTGGLELKSGVTLHLLEGAILEGSRDPEDYMPPLERLLGNVSGDDPRLKAGASGQPFSRWNNAIVRAFGAHDIAVVGERHSYIDGMNCYDAKGEEGYRGPHVMNFWYCTNVVFRGYTVRNSANWAHAVFNSADIKAERLTVLGGHDGFDVRTCDRVRIEDCVFRTGDDGVAGYDDIDVVVRGCLFDCSCNALRFGGTDVLVEKCRGISPTSWGHRYRLNEESRRLAVNDGKQLRHDMGSVFCYYCDYRAAVRRTPGNILIRDCSFVGPRRIFLLDFGKKWSCNRSLSSIVYERCSFTELSEDPLYIMSDPKEPLSITLKDCRVAARKSSSDRPIALARDFRRIALENVEIEGYDNPHIKADDSGELYVRGGTKVGRVPLGK